ncbi:MAG: hypothetical protein GXO26_09905, partial [Crenarchaeota archaeon]|nr:hypothetical protein [Thermoproteota archaeon]
MNLKIVKIVLKYHWGYWIRAALSSAREATHLVPLPCTIYGAFTGCIGRTIQTIYKVNNAEVKIVNNELILEWPYILKESIIAIYVRLDNGHCIAINDITRHFQGPYIRLENIANPQMRFGVRPTGKVYAPCSTFTIKIVVNMEKFKEVIRNILKEDVKNSDIERILLTSALSITRIGSLESVVTVDNVKILKANVETVDENIARIYKKQHLQYAFEIMGSLENYFQTYDIITRFWTIINVPDWKCDEYWYIKRRLVRNIIYAIPVENALY